MKIKSIIQGQLSWSIKLCPWNFHQNQNQFQWIIWKVKYLWNTKSGIINELFFLKKVSKKINQRLIVPVAEFFTELSNISESAVIPIIVSSTLVKIIMYLTNNRSMKYKTQHSLCIATQESKPSIKFLNILPFRVTSHDYLV